MTLSKHEAIQQIREAFAPRPYPGDGQLALAQPGGPDDEAVAIAQLLQGRDWRDLTVELIAGAPGIDRQAFMSFMSAEGFAYFLPGFLILSFDLDGPLDLGESLSFKLTPPADAGAHEQRAHFQQIVDALTDAEQRAVMHGFQYLAAAMDARGYTVNLARRALDSYWGALDQAED